MPPLPVTAAQALLTSIGNDAKALFDIRGNPLANPAGFLADPTAAPPSQAAAKALGRQICRAWARNPDASTNPAADRLYAGVCGPYLDSIGEGVDPGEIGPPFEGGQCPEPYLVALSTGGDLSNTESPTVRARGPITGTRALDIGNSNWALQLGCTGLVAGASNCGAVSNTGAGFYTVRTVTSFTGNVFIRINGVSPCGANNCGNPPPEYERPRPPITLPPITPIFIDLPDIGEINVDVNVDAEGLINIESPTLNVEVNLGSPGDGDGEGGGSGGGDPGDPTDPGSPGAGGSTGPGGEEEGTAPEGQEIVGLLVTVTTAPNDANRFDNNPRQPFRGIGYIRMGYPGRLGLDITGGTVISPQFFHAPQRGLTNWAVAANTGFDLTVVPYYRQIDE